MAQTDRPEKKRHPLRVGLDRWLTALGFLTIVPVGGELHSADIPRSLVFFPLVGLQLGAVAAVAAVGLVHLWPLPVAACLLVALLLGFSGGLHADGLADAADGLGSARDREQKLAIMRDSRIGTMGVLALVLVLAIKGVSLASLDADRLWRAVLLMVLAGRCSLLVMLALLPYARSQGGLATFFYQGRSSRLAGWGGGVLLVSAVLAGGLTGWSAALAALAVVVLFSFWCHRSLGGATGDTLGAACELAETAVALVFALLCWNN